MARLNISRFTDIKPIGSLVPDLPPSVGAICNKALEMDPEKRYHTPGAMLNEVQAVLHRLESGHVDEKKAVDHVVTQVDADADKEGMARRY